MADEIMRVFRWKRTERGRSLWWVITEWRDAG
jgi:hypothetical protein